MHRARCERARFQASDQDLKLWGNSYLEPAVYNEIRLIFRIQNSSSALRARKVSSFRLGFEAFGKKLLGTCCV